MLEINSPLEHFELNIVLYLYNTLRDFSLNSGFFYLLSFSFFCLLFFLFLNKAAVIPSFSNIFVENIFGFVLTIFKQQINSIRSLRFLPMMFTLFLFIFLLNFLSLFIFGVSLSGHILITSFFSFSFFLSFFIIGLLNFGVRFFDFFIPKGVPEVLLDFIIVIEVFSFVIRPFSLAIRLFANMLAGHTLIGIFSQFCAFIANNFISFFLLPIILVLAVFTLEVAVSIIQAYIFVSLVCIYLNDVSNLH